jgi:hypothetical protein
MKKYTRYITGIAVVLLFVSACAVSSVSETPTPSLLDILDLIHPSPVPISILSSNLRPTAIYLSERIPRTPDFIAELKPAPNEKAENLNQVCIYISQGALVQAGDDADKLSKQIGNSLKLFVNNQSIPISPYILSKHLTLNLKAINKTPVSYGGNIFICIPVQLSNGLNLAMVQVVDTSGKVFSYIWMFETE